MDIASLTAYAMTIAALAIKPGPGVLAVVSRAASRGVPGFVSYMSGATLGEVFYLALVAFGFVLLGDELLFLSILLKALAGVYLIYLGYNTLKQPFDITLHTPKDGGMKSNWEDFSTGLMLTLSNPFVIVVFGGIVPTVISPDNVSVGDFAILAAVTVIVQVSIDFIYCAPVLFSRHFFKMQTLERLRIVSGIVMILIGLYLGFSALPAEDILSVFNSAQNQ